MNTCINCANFSRCELLTDRKGMFDLNKLIMEGSDDECTRWSKVNARAEVVRNTLYEAYGLQALQAVHMLPRTALENPEEDDVEIPDFKEMLEKGVTYKEREAQLRYETDESGEFILDPNDKRIPRSSFVLRKYVTDPEGTVGLDSKTTMFWSPKQLIDSILAAEKETGLLLSPTDKKKLAAEGGQEENMAKVSTATKRVSVRRPGGGGAAAAPAKAGGKGKTTAPKGGVRRSPATAKKTKPAAEVEPEASSGNGEAVAAEVDTDSIAAAVVEALTPVIEEKIEAAKAAILDELGAVVNNTAEAAGEIVVHDMTILHDTLVQRLDAEDADETLLDKEMTLRSLVEPEEAAEGNE